MDQSTKITAYDVDKGRLDNLAGRKKRLQLPQIEIKKNIAGHQYDLVIADVPCSGSGTWRRNPDQVWQLSEQRLNEHSILQRQIMSEAELFTKTGGHFAYMTCSIFPQENQQQVEWFLANYNNYELVNIADLWPKCCNGSYPSKQQYLQLLPNINNTDGFFISIFRKIS